MPVKAPYRVRQQSQSVGTGAYLLLAAPGSANPFSAFYANGAVVGYVAFDQSGGFEIGYGALSSSGNGSISRTTIILSSNANSAVNWGVGTRDVIVFWPAGMPTVDVSGTTNVGLADWGNVFVGSGAGAVVNLPEIDTVPAGFSLEFRNAGSGNYTFTPYATDGDLIEGLTSLACPPGSWSTIYLDAGQWRVLSAPLAVLGSMINPSLSGILNLGIKSASAYDLVINSTESLTAQRTLTITTGDANRSITLGGNFTTAGGNVTLTGQSGGSSVTLPSSGTLMTNALSNTHIFVGNGSGVATDVALSGDATIANTGALTIANGAVSLAKMASFAASSLMGNPTGSGATPSAITLGATLAFSGTALQTAALTGDATAAANSFATTVVKVNGVAYPASPSTNTVPVVTGSNQITYEAVPNAALANSSMTIAGHVIALGGTQAIAAADLSNGTSGSGAVVLVTGATLVTPALGVASATSLALGGATIGGNALAVTGSVLFNTALGVASGGTGVATVAANGLLYGAGTSALQVLAANATGTIKYLQQVSSGAPAWVQIAASDLSNGVTGSGAVVLAASPTLSGTMNAAAGVFSGTLQVTGHVTLEGVTSAGATGTGNLVFATSPSFTTPVLGVASATSINKVAITAPGTGSTLTIADGKTLTASASITLAGTDGKTLTVSNSLTLAGTDATVITFQGSDTYVGRSTTDTLINKTLNFSNNTISNFTLAMGAANVFDTDSALTANSDTRVATQKAIKSYVDNAVTGLFWKAAVVVRTTANITLAGEQTIDGVLTSGSRVLVMAQTDQTQNGIYVSAAGAWARSSDADTGPELVSATMFVSQGTTWHDTQWTCTNDTITIGVTNIAFAQVSGAGTYSAGQGLTLSGNQFSVTNNGITYAMIQTVAAVSLIGNPTGGSATPQGITLGAALAFSGTALQTAAMTGDVTASANSFATTVAKIQGTVVSGTTGSGNVAFSTSPTFVTPALGTPASGVLKNCTSLPVGSITGLGTGVATWLATPSSANLAAAMTDETGTGALVFGTSPTITTPTISGHFVMEGVTTTGATGTGNIVFSASPTISGTLTATTISMSGHLTVEGVTSAGATGTGNFVFSIAPTITGHPTIEGVTSTGATGTGAFVFASSPTLVTPTLGAATATTINKLTLTAPATGATFTLADGKTLTVSNTMTLTANDTASIAFGAGGTVLYSGAAISVGAVTVTSSSANALAVGQNGTTNPGLKVDCSTATSVTGLLVKTNIGGSGLALSIITSGTNEPLTIDAAGSGTITLGGTSTGAITLTRATTISASLTYGGVTLTNAVSGTGKMLLDASPTITGHATIEGVTATGATGTGNFMFSASPTTTGTLTAAAANFSGNVVLSSGVTLKLQGVAGQILGSGGAVVATPSYAFDGDTGTGFYNPAAHSIGVSINGAEKVRFASDGSFLVGTTTNAGAGNISASGTVIATQFGAPATVAGWGYSRQFDGSAAGGMILRDTASSNGAEYHRFQVGASTTIGGIVNNNNTGVLYNTTSDERLKTWMIEQTDYRAAIQSLMVGDFTWNATGSKGFGVLAQQAYATFGGIGIAKPANDADMWQASSEPFGFMALWGVKDLYAMNDNFTLKMDDHEDRIVTLERKNAALEAEVAELKKAA